MNTVLDHYGQVQPNLLRHDKDFPPAAQLRGLVKSGQSAYGMAAVGAGKTTAGSQQIIAAADRADARPLWITRLGRREHARAGALRRAGHALAGGGRQVRGQAARLLDLRPGRRGPVDPARVPGALVRRQALNPGRRRVLHRHLDRDQRRQLLPQRRGRGLHDGHQRVARRRTSAAKGRSARGYPQSALHHGGRHAVVPRADRQRARLVASPSWGGWGGRYVYRQPYGETRPLWTQGGDAFAGE